MIDANFPRPRELKELDKATLRFLRCASIITSNFPHLAYSANVAYATVNLDHGPLSFESHVSLLVEQAPDSIPREVYIGAKIEVINKKHYENICYSIAVCESEMPRRPILRKFHFDYEDPGNRQLNDPKPSFHLQFCGELSPGLRMAGYGDNEVNHLCPWLSKPRIPFMPMSLALLLNMILLECRQTPEAHKILESPEWRGIVEANEKRILKPFFQGCAGFVAGPNRRLLTNEFFYNQH
jgi:hypothetical protein